MSLKTTKHIFLELRVLSKLIIFENGILHTKIGIELSSKICEVFNIAWNMSKANWRFYNYK